MNLSFKHGASGWPFPQFVYDQKDTANQFAGLSHRLANDIMPVPGPDFREFYEATIRRYWPVITPSEVPSLREWLDGSSYNMSRKEYLYKCCKELERFGSATTESECFLKNEGYDPKSEEGKNPRNICSPNDATKGLLGPIFHAVDHKVFTDEFLKRYFVKGGDIRDWPKLMYDRFGGRPVANTDFTSMECHHRGELARCNLFWIRHVIRGLRGWLPRPIYRCIVRLIMGVNVIKTKLWVLKIVEVLMSGVAWTSSGNAHVNLLLNSYLVLRSAFPDESGEQLAGRFPSFNGIFEGDDGLFEEIPGHPVTKEMMDGMGIKLKYERHPNYATAKFCSIVVPFEGENLSYDPLKALVNLSHVDGKLYGARFHTQAGMLRAKALSYRVLFPRSPVVSALSWRILYETRGTDCRKQTQMLLESSWHKLSMRDLTKVDHKSQHKISMHDRLAYEECFGLSIEDQLAIEQAAYDLSNVGLELPTQSMSLFPAVPIGEKRTEKFLFNKAMADICDLTMVEHERGEKLKRLPKARLVATSATKPGCTAINFNEVIQEGGVQPKNPRALKRRWDEEMTDTGVFPPIYDPPYRADA